MKALILFFAFTLGSLIIISGCRQIFGDGTEPESIVEVPIETSKFVVTAPERGDIWNPGDIMKIKWLAVSIKRIDIELYRKSAYQFSLAEDIENTGSLEWLIPADINLSNHYLIKIINHNNPDTYGFSGRFGIQ